MARRSKRVPNALSSIHDPPDPSTSILSKEVRGEWDKAYEQAFDEYGSKELAKRAAWRTINLTWRNTGKKTWERCQNGLCQPWPRSQVLPQPQADLIGLGVLIEYSFVDKTGELHLRVPDRDHPPILWWDDDRKALYAFPQQPYPGCRPIPKDMRKAVADYKRWHQREPECYDDVDVPLVRVSAVGAGDTISYRSDKWHDRDPDPRVLAAQEYIHNHWYDVWVWQDRDDDGINAIMIEGGELDMHERGIIH